MSSSSATAPASASLVAVESGGKSNQITKAVLSRLEWIETECTETECLACPPCRCAKFQRLHLLAHVIGPSRLLVPTSIWSSDLTQGVNRCACIEINLLTTVWCLKPPVTNQASIEVASSVSLGWRRVTDGCFRPAFARRIASATNFAT